MNLLSAGVFDLPITLNIMIKHINSYTLCIFSYLSKVTLSLVILYVFN